MDLHDPKFPKSLPSWFNAIAHVPQNIYLSDSSIAENIAFGVPREHIDMDRVKQAALQAQIASFIESSLRIMELLWVREAFVSVEGSVNVLVSQGLSTRGLRYLS